MSLKDKFKWDGNNLTINGSITLTNTIPNTSITGLGSLSTQNSLALGGGYLTGFGSLAGQNSVSTGQVT